MLATSVGALAYQGVRFWTSGRHLLGGVSAALIVLAGFIAWEARALLRARRAAVPSPTAPAETVKNVVPPAGRR
jgi:hypothetical protein